MHRDDLVSLIMESLQNPAYEGTSLPTSLSQYPGRDLAVKTFLGLSVPHLLPEWLKLGHWLLQRITAAFLIPTILIGHLYDHKYP